MTMGGKAFIDTNILLRAFHEPFAEHVRARALVDQMVDDDYELWISRQVIREYLVQVTSPRTFVDPLPIETVIEQLTSITTLYQVADENDLVTAKLLELLKAYPTRGKQVHDANIVATMLTYGIDTLLTLNIADLKRFEDKIRLLSLTEESK